MSFDWHDTSVHIVDSFRLRHHTSVCACEISTCLILYFLQILGRFLHESGRGRRRIPATGAPTLEAELRTDRGCGAGGRWGHEERAGVQVGDGRVLNSVLSAFGSSRKST